MSKTLRFSLPMPINLANSRMHWRVKENHRQAFMAACDMKRIAGELPPPPDRPFPLVTAKVTLYLGSAMDDDNAANRCKWAWDWLKTRGYILDDKRANLKQLGFPDQKVKRDKNYRIEIAITPLNALPQARSA